jgi:hypothetical protein
VNVTNVETARPGEEKAEVMRGSSNMPVECEDPLRVGKSGFAPAQFFEWT